MDAPLEKPPGAMASKQRPRAERAPMPHGPAPRDRERPAIGRGRWPFVFLAALAAAGCGHQDDVDFSNLATTPTARLIRPETRTIVREVGQPSFIESYERTPIYPKPTAYIREWKVDIGDHVEKGQVLATLFVPELVEEWGTRQAAVALDEQRIRLAKEEVRVAAADVQAAEASLEEAREILDKFQAEVDRWNAEVQRLRHEIQGNVVDRRVLDESIKQFDSSVAARDQAKAVIERADAELGSRRAALAKAEVGVRVAEAALEVAQSEEKYAKAWVDYLTLTAPFTGVVTVRNANTYDFILPSTGDPTANARSPHDSPNRAAAPIYVIDRTDKVRIFIDVPEHDANYVRAGSKAMVLVKAHRDEPIQATVTRTSWALNMKSRTLRVEVDLPNPGGRLLPGMYAYVKIMIERPEVRALPVAAVSYVDDKAYYWAHNNGRAARVEVRTGVSDDEWIEVTNRRPAAAALAASPWAPIDGTEQVLLGDLDRLVDGGPVEVAPRTVVAQLARRGEGTHPPAAVGEPRKFRE